MQRRKVSIQIDASCPGQPHSNIVVVNSAGCFVDLCSISKNLDTKQVWEMLVGAANLDWSEVPEQLKMEGGFPMFIHYEAAHKANAHR